MKIRSYARFLLSALLLISVIGVSASYAQTKAPPSAGQAILEAIRINEPLDFCGEPVPLDDPDVRERLERELLVSLDNSDDIILWLKRANRYFPDVEKVLKAQSLPDDLKYITIAESSLRPLAFSNKGAAGYWQFIEGTGKKYGLEISGDIDERRNVHRATQAAVTYLKDLHELFGSWTLAAAACAWVIAILLGSVVGVMRTTPSKWAQRIGNAWVELFRNIPLLVQLFLWYFVLPEVLPKGMGDSLKQMAPPWGSLVPGGMGPGGVMGLRGGGGAGAFNSGGVGGTGGARGYGGYGGAGGMGKLIAEWIIDGEAPMDVYSYRATRFGNYYSDPVYAAERTKESVKYYYRLRFPHDEHENARPHRVSPVHYRLLEHGAVFGEKFGWERVNYFQPGKP